MRLGDNSSYDIGITPIDHVCENYSNRVASQTSVVPRVGQATQGWFEAAARSR